MQSQIHLWYKMSMGQPGAQRSRKDLVKSLDSNPVCCCCELRWGLIVKPLGANLALVMMLALLRSNQLNNLNN